MLNHRCSSDFKRPSNLVLARARLLGKVRVILGRDSCWDSSHYFVFAVCFRVAIVSECEPSAKKSVDKASNKMTFEVSKAEIGARWCGDVGLMVLCVMLLLYDVLGRDKWSRGIAWGSSCSWRDLSHFAARHVCVAASSPIGNIVDSRCRVTFCGTFRVRFFLCWLQDGRLPLMSYRTLCALVAWRCLLRPLNQQSQQKLSSLTRLGAKLQRGRFWMHLV